MDVIDERIDSLVVIIDDKESIEVMSDLMKLSKFELMSKIQTIERQKNSLKTLLFRHKLLTNFYEKLYENCIQMNSENKNNNKIKLKAKQKRLLSQIQAITECDKSLEISLIKIKSKDIESHLFIEKWTQSEDQKSSELEPISDLRETNCESNTHLLTNGDTKVSDIPLPPEQEKVWNEKQNSNEDMNSSQDTSRKKKSKIINGSKKEKNFFCNYCQKGYKLKKSLDNHVIQIHKYVRSDGQKEEKSSPLIDNVIDCPLIECQWPECRLKFRNRTLFLRHYSVHNEMRKVCSDCGVRCETSDQLREHLSCHSKISCRFPNCNYKTGNASHLEVHQMKAHEKIYISL